MQYLHFARISELLCLGDIYDDVSLIYEFLNLCRIQLKLKLVLSTSKWTGGKRG